jgi:hypothetical protein
MKMKHLSSMAAVVVATIGIAPAHATQQQDTQRAYASSGTADPDLARQVREQSGSPRRKADLYMAAPSATPDSNLVRAVRYQNASPRRKPDLYVAAPSAVPDPDLVREIRYQNGSPKSKK